MKLVDNVVPAADLVKAAKDWIKAGGKAKAPWDIDGFKLPGGLVYSKAGMMTFPPANAIYRRETYDNYPGRARDPAGGLRGAAAFDGPALTVESRWFAKILRSPEAAAMIRSLFVSMQDLNKGARRPADVPASKLKKVGILGAGFMGAGIAYVSAQAGLDVVLIDRDQESADKGKAHIHKLMTDLVNKGRAKTADRDALLARIAADRRLRRAQGLRPRGRGGVRGSQGQGRRHRQGAGRACPTSYSGPTPRRCRSVRSRRRSKDPARFIGIHFFSPVERMMLVEIIMGKQTGDEALALALDYVRAIRKTPIVVNDSRGFYTSRVVGTYIREGHLMLTEGMPAGDGRECRPHGRHAGRPAFAQRRGRGRSRLEDSQGHRSRSRPRGGRCASRRSCSRRWWRSAAGSAARTARAFTIIPRKARSGCGPASTICSRRAQRRRDRHDPGLVEELKQRLLAIQALETARCFEEGVLTDVREADVGSILGFGFAPFSGGTLSYIDMMGDEGASSSCARGSRQKYGPRFKPAELLIDMAKSGDSFYRRFPSGARRAA